MTSIMMFFFLFRLGLAFLIQTMVRVTVRVSDRFRVKFGSGLVMG